MWRGVPDALHTLTGRRTVVYSRAGYGHSGTVSLPRPVTYMHHEADVVLPELLAALDIDRPILIGHSDGASIAMLHAGARHPVSALVLLAPHVVVEDVTVTSIAAARGRVCDHRPASQAEPVPRRRRRRLPRLERRVVVGGVPIMGDHRPSAGDRRTGARGPRRQRHVRYERANSTSSRPACAAPSSGYCCRVSATPRTSKHPRRYSRPSSSSSVRCRLCGRGGRSRSCS